LYKKTQSKIKDEMTKF